MLKLKEIISGLRKIAIKSKKKNKFNSYSFFNRKNIDTNFIIIMQIEDILHLFILDLLVVFSSFQIFQHFQNVPIE